MCPCPDILFGGARGGGKSDGLLGDFAAHAMRSKGNARGILLRRTMPQLEEVIERSKFLYPQLGARWIAGARMWLFPCGSTLKMRWLDRDADADNYQGHQYTWIGFDEAGTWPDPAPLDKLRATLRSPHGVPCVVRLTANPGGFGHQWIKARYIDPSPPRREFYDKLKFTRRVYIPSRLKDNRKLTDSDPDYENRIRSSGAEWLVRAWLDGDWEASAGDNYFDESALKVDGKPVQYPTHCDAVYAIVDTALKDGLEHDGTGVVYYAINYMVGPPITILDWDIVQIKGALLIDWLPAINRRLQELAQVTRARRGSLGIMVEDKGSGIILLQQAAIANPPLPAYPIPSEYTAMGKEGRAMSVSGMVYSHQIKISEFAYDKGVMYKEQYMNHFISQVCYFKLGQKDGPRDLLDCFCYGIQVGLNPMIAHR